MGNRIVHFEIQADDVQRAQNFYQKTLGWKFDLMKTKDEIGMDYWGVTTGKPEHMGINGGMYQRPKENPLHTYDCTVAVDDIDQVLKAVVENGGSITMQKTFLDDVGYMAGVLDTEGNRLGVLQPVEMRAR